MHLIQWWIFIPYMKHYRVKNLYQISAQYVSDNRLVDWLLLPHTNKRKKEKSIGKRKIYEK